MAFSSAFEAIFNQSGNSKNTARNLISSFSKHNAGFRNFKRTPFGRAAANSASLFDDFFMDADGLNSASYVGGLNSGSGANAAYGIIGNLLDDLVQQALTRRKVTTTTRESDRSVEAQKLWNSSRSEQDALLATMVQRGLGEI